MAGGAPHQFTSLGLDVCHVLKIVPLSEVTENQGRLTHYISSI